MLLYFGKLLRLMSEIKLILGSKSPRRQSLIKELGFEVEIRQKEVEEIYPETLDSKMVPEYLSRLKAEPLIDSIKDNEVLVTSDTIVLLDDEVIGKPKSEKDAKEMIGRLSGRSHEVITGVCLTSIDKQITFSSTTHVEFDDLSQGEIDSYVDKFQPMDKAGSYAIQEWIGYIGVKGIRGCYYNVMGLPLNALYQSLKENFIEK